MDVYPPLIDQFNRKIGSVRISLTDRCNLRCVYCMPEEGVHWVEKSNILSFEEIVGLVRLFRNCSIKKFRLTGGEPTLRYDIVTLCQTLTDEINDIDLGLTTNAVLLEKLALPLKDAGVRRLNISLDTLDKKKFTQISRRNEFDDVIRGIKAAIDVEFEKIKLNAVAIKDFNTDQESIQKFIEFAEMNNVEIRYIEMMPFTGIGWNKGIIANKNGGNFISSTEIISKIKNMGKISEIPMVDTSQTSRSWTFDKGKAKIGFISSVTGSFCHSCNRIRITAEGNLRPCLHAPLEYPLRDLIRKGATDKELLTQIQIGLNAKWKEHPDFLSSDYIPPFNDREMIRIGG